MWTFLMYFVESKKIGGIEKAAGQEAGVVDPRAWKVSFVVRVYFNFGKC